MISKTEVFFQALKFLNVKVETPELRKVMEICYSDMEKKVTPRGTRVKIPTHDWREHPQYFDIESKDIQSILNKADTLVFLGATLGVASERVLLEMQVRDPMYAFVMDAILSSVVELFLNEQQKELQNEVSPLYVTDRFSPGYGDFSIEYQKKLGSILNISKKLGVRFNESGIMIPRKSVLALCGIQEEKPEYRHRGCEACNLKNKCELKEIGRRCSIYGG